MPTRSCCACGVPFRVPTSEVRASSDVLCDEFRSFKDPKCKGYILGPQNTCW